MANRNGREALRGVEVQTVDLIFQVLVSEPQWTRLLKGPLERAASQGDRGLARELVEAGADATANQKGRAAIRGAEVQTLDLIAEVLLSEEWAELLKGPLEHAAGQGNKDLAQKLVEAGAEIGNALHAAVRGGQREVISNLLESGAPINAKDPDYGRTPLHVAAQEGKPEMAQLLMLKGADKDAVNNKEWTPLLTATFFGRVTAALALLAGGADIHLRCGFCQMSVMHVAAEKGHVDILRATIKGGSNVGAVDRSQGTALHRAALNNKTEAVDLLVEAGANIEARNNNGSTPLHYAVRRLSLGALTALLNHGAHINAQDGDLRTPLFYAATQAGSQGAVEVVRLLLRSGADEAIVGRDGYRAVEAVATGVDEEERLTEDVERVRKMLANAPADRAWRRRGYLVLCRTHPNRVQQAEESCSVAAGMSRMTRSAAKLLRSETRGCSARVEGSAVGEGVRAGWAIAVAHVLGLQEEGIFRTIVGYL